MTCDEKWILGDNRKRSAPWLDHDEGTEIAPIEDCRLPRGRRNYGSALAE